MTVFHGGRVHRIRQKDGDGIQTLRGESKGVFLMIHAGKNWSSVGSGQGSALLPQVPSKAWKVGYPNSALLSSNLNIIG